METLKFKTTIKCSGCVDKVTPYLNATAGEDNWKVDIKSLDKVLTVVKENNITEQEVVKAITEAGYKAERLP